MPPPTHIGTLPGGDAGSGEGGRAGEAAVGWGSRPCRPWGRRKAPSFSSTEGGPYPLTLDRKAVHHQDVEMLTEEQEEYRPQCPEQQFSNHLELGTPYRLHRRSPEQPSGVGELPRAIAIKEPAGHRGAE